ncbi:hypothetical protein Hte_000550 [Hypoxylon texense]
MDDDGELAAGIVAVVAVNVENGIEKLIGWAVEILGGIDTWGASITLMECEKKIGVVGLEHFSARAWLAHLDLLKFVVASDLKTALIVKNDVDWDVRIKAQMNLVSDNARAHTGVTESDPTPSGIDWDVLWLSDRRRDASASYLCG